MRLSGSALNSLAGLLLWATSPATALPWPSTTDDLDFADFNSTLQARADPGDFYLRILPLGASIVAGEYSQDSNKNGFRKFIRDKLRERGWKVNMVGNQNSGTMADSDHEGISGQTVTQVAARGRDAARTWLPNVVLINAGTNDANDKKGDVDAGRTGLQMKELIEGIFAEVPQAVVVLSTLLPKGSNADYVAKINDQYRTVYRQFVPVGNDGNELPNPQFKVVLAEMQPFLSIGDIHDSTHPTILGERKMAAVWDWAIGVANDRGWITAPKQSSAFADGDGSTTCKKKFGSGASDPRSGRQILFAADPLIRDDGGYIHSSVLRDDKKGSFTKALGGGPDADMKKDSDIWFAQLVNSQNTPKGDEMDEIILAPSDKSDRVFTMYVNDGTGYYQNGYGITTNLQCSNAHIRWADLNGDGLDDFICVQANGDIYASLNRGGTPPTFQAVGLYKSQEMSVGRDRVRVADVDGDGRADYCVISNAGNFHCWRNGGTGDKAAYWQDMTPGTHIFASQNTGDARGVHLIDINNDGRADWTFMTKEGQVTTFINQRGDGKGMRPYWRSAGVTHPGRGVNIGDNREFIKWGRIFSGKPSYVHWKREGTLCNGGVICRIEYQVWENKGSGGISQKGDGIFWGDTTGSGVDDYIWISMFGEVNTFVNKNTRAKHDHYATNAWGTPSMIATNLPRRALHIGDWDGDGKDDIIGVRNLKTGALTVWFSRWSDGKHNWQRQDIADPGREWCTQGHGRLPFDNAHYFADLTKSGRVDYICMAPNGQAWAWLRGKDGVAVPSGQIKYTEDLDRANFGFSDINGDGHSDLIHKDKFNGNTRVWYFEKQVTEAERAGNSGSIIKWSRPEVLFSGSVRGPDTHYPKLGNQGRGDMVYAQATNAKAHISYNACPAGGDDDQTDSDLPTYTPPDLSPNPEDIWFCDGNGAKWTTQLWNSHGVGTWFTQRSNLYSSAENRWPRDEDGEGVPRIIAEYDVFKRDQEFNWPPNCRALSATCNPPNDFGKSTYCKYHQERGMSLWAMKNFAEFQQKWWKAVDSGVKAAGLVAADVADKFLPVAETTPAGDAAWLTILAGIFTSIGGIAPGAGAGASNVIAGVFTVGAGAVSFGASDNDPPPEFRSFAQIGAALDKIRDRAKKAMATQFDRYFADTPPDNDRDKGSELARALQSGLWANQNIATADSNTIWDDGKVKNLIVGAMISEMWNTGDVAIVKWSKDHPLAAKWGFNPCYGNRDQHGMSRHVACVNDRNFIIAQQIRQEDVSGTRKWPDIGSHENVLRDYDLNHVTVINAAERTQKRTQSFQPAGLSTLGSLFTDAAKQAESSRASYMTYFNVPVCDLDLAGSFETYMLFEESYDWCKSAGNAGDYMSVCLSHIFAKNCRKLSLPGGKWPYQNNVP